MIGWPFGGNIEGNLWKLVNILFSLCKRIMYLWPVELKSDCMTCSGQWHVSRRYTCHFQAEIVRERTWFSMPLFSLPQQLAMCGQLEPWINMMQNGTTANCTHVAWTETNLWFFFKPLGFWVVYYCKWIATSD